MASNPSDPSSPRPGGLQSLLARLRGMVQSLKPGEEAPPAAIPLAPAANAAPGDQSERHFATEANGSEDEMLPTWDENVLPAETAPPVALPAGEGETVEGAPAALPLAETPTVSAAGAIPDWVSDNLAASAPPAPPAAVPAPVLCPVCGSPRANEQASCGDCGYYFSAADLAVAGTAPDPPAPAGRLQDRFELRERISQRGTVERFRGLDHGDGSGPPVPVIILRQELPKAEAAPVAEVIAESVSADEDVLPGFDNVPATSAPATEVLPGSPQWPSISWERGLLRVIQHPSLPNVIATSADDAYEYLVEEVPAGRSLWDAWDDPEASAERRFGWLAQLAEALQSLHHVGAIVEGLRPDVVIVTDDGKTRLTDLSDLLPLPLPPDTPVRGSPSTAPEILAGKGNADARADLYAFGALLYALHVGRELTETDFDGPGRPKPFIPRFPDVHPALGRLLSKTFRREVETRFPTDEAARTDPSGFNELIRTLQAVGRTLDTARLEIAAWTTTGMVRTGNEDAFALLHATETRQDDLGDAALVLLADGMGGYEAGEVAAALAIQVLRQNLVGQKPFTALAGGSAFPTDVLKPNTRPEAHAPEALDVAACQAQIKAALKEANRQVFVAARVPGSGRRGMGCTAEVVYVDGRNVVVGHVGDSRTYHLHEGRMIQLTRDQTLVNRLVELGTLTPEEAETHPRRNELQQAVGGQPDVEPGLYHGILKPGDWVVVCSDGLSNHVTAEDLKQMLQSEAASAEMAARRLVNLANIEGATDNATVVVIRAT
jgi:serine/threonine protein phosphatase PrpC